jgi:hypothetical protein
MEASKYCRHCGAETGTYSLNGIKKYYVSCRKCKDLPPPGKVRCKMYYGFSESDRCKNYHDPSFASCYKCRNVLSWHKCFNCMKMFSGTARTTLCDACYKKDELSLEDLFD